MNPAMIGYGTQECQPGSLLGGTMIRTSKEGLKAFLENCMTPIGYALKMAQFGGKTSRSKPMRGLSWRKRNENWSKVYGDTY
jgi:hypothetical protein